jgi:protein gp37
MTKRLQTMGQKKYAAGFDCVVCHEWELTIPFSWRKPRRVFVNSMSDTFHEDVPVRFIAGILATAALLPRHTFSFLTKRAKRMAWVINYLYNTEEGNVDIGDAMLDRDENADPCEPTYPLPNVEMGVTIETPDYLWRLNKLRKTPAACRFLSLEPLLAPMPELNLKGIHGVILGGESGPKARPMHPDWARGVRDQCVAAGVPYFFKQWGEWVPGEVDAKNNRYVFQNGDIVDRDLVRRLLISAPNNFRLVGVDGECICRRVGKARAGRVLDGREWNELPGKESK